jgi:hypothetical protein
LLEGLRHAARALEREHRRFAVVGGLAVAVRAEPRFTRDVDLAIAARDDADVESLVFSLQGGGYQVVALVDHESQHRLATARLVGPSGLVVDLVAATCGIEAEVVDRATGVTLPEVGPIRVARAEELLAMKVLSMTEQRAQDRLDAISLLLVNDAIDLAVVRDNLRLITERGFHREQDLVAKLESIVGAARAV